MNSKWVYWLAAFGLLAALCGCTKVKYICPAYQSAFLLDNPVYRVPKGLDSMAIAADTSLDVDVIMMLAERIREVDTIAAPQDADSLTFPADNVIKTQYLLIKKVKSKQKDKYMAKVPMITVFPESSDTTSGEAEEAPEPVKKKRRGKKVLPAEYQDDNSGDRPVEPGKDNDLEPEPEETPNENADEPKTEPATPEEKPAEEEKTPPKKEENANPF